MGLLVSRIDEPLGGVPRLVVLVPPLRPGFLWEPGGDSAGASGALRVRPGGLFGDDSSAATASFGAVGRTRGSGFHILSSADRIPAGAGRPLVVSTCFSLRANGQRWAVLFHGLVDCLYVRCVCVFGELSIRGVPVAVQQKRV